VEVGQNTSRYISLTYNDERAASQRLAHPPEQRKTKKRKKMLEQRI
jgi:hypothetical protein